MSSTNRAESIRRIIQDRKNHARKTFEPLAESLESLILELSELESQGKQLSQKVGNTNDTAKLKNIDSIASHRATLERLAKEISGLIKRFKRDTLNIGVIGDTGRGKSTLLQTITGLGENFFPTGDKEACTVARSIVENGNPTEIKVFFHSEASFISEVIKPFYEKLRFSDVPVSVSNWINISLPELSEIDKESDEKNNFHSHLNSVYKKYAKDYENKLKGGELTILPEEIPNFASHKYDEKLNLTNPECLAVKEIKITHQFKYSDIGSIALVDMPGLGTFRVGDEELMIQTLGNMVDIILFLLKPEKSRVNIRPDEIRLYDRIKEHLGITEKRSFIILNRDKSTGNSDNCEATKVKIQNGDYTWSCVDVLIADCKEYENVNSKVIEVVLSHLELEVTKLDKEYARASIEKIRETLALVKDDLNKVKLSSGANDSNEFLLTFVGRDGKNEEDGFITNLAQVLGEQLFKLAEQSKSQKEIFKGAVEKAIKNCKDGKKDGIPTEQEVKKKLSLKGGAPARLAEYREEIRAYISKYFIELDFNLQVHLEEVKGEVVKKLKSIGLENFGAEHEGSTFLINFLKYFPEDKIEVSAQ
jgi:Dynamin family